MSAQTKSPGAANTEAHSPFQSQAGTQYTIPAGKLVMVTSIPGAADTEQLGRRWDGRFTQRVNVFTDADVICEYRGSIRFRLAPNSQGWTALIAQRPDIQISKGAMTA